MGFALILRTVHTFGGQPSPVPTGESVLELTSLPFSSIRVTNVQVIAVTRRQLGRCAPDCEDAQRAPCDVCCSGANVKVHQQLTTRLQECRSCGPFHIYLRLLAA